MTRKKHHRKFGIGNSEFGIDKTNSELITPNSEFTQPGAQNPERNSVLKRHLLMCAIGIWCLSLMATAALAAEGDVVFKRAGSESETPPAMFPHWSHRIRYKCYACHDSLFQMKAGADTITMAAIMEGKFCGACHNGTVAWPATFETCSKCHVQP